MSLGLIADRVFEVTALDERQHRAAARHRHAWRSDYISGVGRRGDSFVVIFDLPRLLASDAVALLQAPDTRISGSGRGCSALRMTISLRLARANDTGVPRRAAAPEREGGVY